MNIGLLGIGLGVVILAMLGNEREVFFARLGAYAEILFFAFATLAGSKTEMAALVGVTPEEINVFGFGYLGVCALLILFGQGAKK